MNLLITNIVTYRKNDIITVICEKDEHCWVGEVNGLRGWFPAKFVEVIFFYSKYINILFLFLEI